eukprot:scaffold28990_cov32-Prasinocladus_malaysianus.AAC.4
MAATGMKKGSSAGVFGANCPEWMVAMQVVSHRNPTLPMRQACNRMSYICVPLYDTLGENAVEFIINHSETHVVFVQASKMTALVKVSNYKPTLLALHAPPSLQQAWRSLLSWDWCRQVLPRLKGMIKHIIYWGDASEEDISGAKDAKVQGMICNSTTTITNITIIIKFTSSILHNSMKTVSSSAINDRTDLGLQVSKFDDFLESGKDKLTDPVPPGPDDLCTIMYTSGTTGDPKGVMIKHKNVLAEISALQRYLISVGHKQDEHDVFLSYLPLAHIFDRVAEEFYLSIGATIGYWRGDTKGLTEDITTLKPTLFVGVPRVFERIQGGVMAKVRS